jgi:hypothetical protein
MHFVVANMKWIMLLSGVLTSTMVYAVVAPQAALLSTFGETLEGPVAEIVVRNWGALIGLMGAMLVYGAFEPAERPLILMVAVFVVYLVDARRARQSIDVPGRGVRVRD